jgi:tetratricopeptide (TPR) repeat protein
MDPAQPEVDFALGQALLESGRASDAVPHLRRAFEAGVRTDLSGFDLARALASTGDRQGAIVVLQKVRPARADDAESWFALGQLAFELRAAGLAEGFYRQAAIARPTFAAARQQLGLTYAILGRFQEAARELEQATGLSPTDPAAHLNLAVAYAELGRTEDARRHAQRALELNPDYDRARQLLGVLK